MRGDKIAASKMPLVAAESSERCTMCFVYDVSESNPLVLCDKCDVFAHKVRGWWGEGGVAVGVVPNCIFEFCWRRVWNPCAASPRKQKCWGVRHLAKNKPFLCKRCEHEETHGRKPESADR